MAREPINTGSSSIAAIGNIASSYAQNVAIANSQTNGIFDRYLAHQKSLREEALANAKLDEEKKLNESKINIANEQAKNLQKQNEYFDKDKALQERNLNSEIANRNAGSAYNYAQAASINQNTQEKKDLQKLQNTAVQNPPQTPPQPPQQKTALDAANFILPTEQY